MGGISGHGAIAHRSIQFISQKVSKLDPFIKALLVAGKSLSYLVGIASRDLKERKDLEKLIISIEGL